MLHSVQQSNLIGWPMKVPTLITMHGIHPGDCAFSEDLCFINKQTKTNKMCTRSLSLCPAIHSTETEQRRLLSTEVGVPPLNLGFQEIYAIKHSAPSQRVREELTYV